MSTDSSDDDGQETSGGPRRAVRGAGRQVGRLAGAAAGVVGIGSLAGCSMLAGEDPDASSESGPEPAGTATPSGRTAPATPTATRSADECEESLPQVEQELSSLAEERTTVESRLMELEAERSLVESRYQRWQSAPADVVAQAESVGTDARDAVVFLELGSSGLATGWYVDDHHVLTNSHNVYHAGQRTDGITVWTLDGEERFTEVLGYTESNVPDVALLRTDETAPATLPIGEAALERGDYVVQVGHPGGIGNWVISLGEFREEIRFETMDGTRADDMVTTVPGRSGVSGSPLLDLEGRVVAMTHGGQDIQTMQPGESPSVAADVVYDRPMAPRQQSLHVPIDVVMDTQRGWR